MQISEKEDHMLALRCALTSVGIASFIANIATIVILHRGTEFKNAKESDVFVSLLTANTGLGLVAIAEGATFDMQLPDEVCMAKACVLQYFGLASFLWAAAVLHLSERQVLKHLMQAVSNETTR
jgi:hypothetical protein